MASARSDVEVTPWDALSGQYRLCPGEPRSVVGQRPVLGAGRLARLLHGQDGEQVGRTLTSVFTLCAHAHRHTAALALGCAQAVPAGVAPASPELLWIETARDHLRSMALDWPQRLPEGAPAEHALDWLQACPLPLATPHACRDAAQARALLSALRVWLETRILGQSATDWLIAHRDPATLARWCLAHADRLGPARFLAAWHPVASRLTPPLRALDVLDADAARQTRQLQPLASSIVDDLDFVQHPTWQGACAENGPWTRLRHRAQRDATPHGAWTRMSARWRELVELATADPHLPSVDGLPVLASGAMALGAGAALAWCEMARGLLLHWVQLDPQGGVRDYRVLAPTEWNFHPQGALARAVAALPPGDTAAARALAAAYDPCVACTVQTGAA